MNNRLEEIKNDSIKALNIPTTNRNFLKILNKRRIICTSKYYQNYPMLQSKLLTDLELNLQDTLTEYSTVTQLNVLYPNIPIYNSTSQLLDDYARVQDEFQICSPKAMKDLDPKYWLPKIIESQKNNITSSVQYIKSQRS